MFWKTQRAGETELPHTAAERAEAGQYLRARLRLALEFATLGEYESEHGHPSSRQKATCASGSGIGGQEHVHVLREAARPHAQARTDNCETVGPAAGSCGMSGVVRRVPKVPARRGSTEIKRRRRAGQVGQPEQPCVWAGS
jgi:hypothetical protein